MGAAPPRFLVIDLQRVTGLDASAVVAFRKSARLAGAHGIELSSPERPSPCALSWRSAASPRRTAGLRFEPDLDRGLERCEDVLLAEELRPPTRR